METTPDLVTEIIKTTLAIATPVLATLLSALVLRAVKRMGIELDSQRALQVEKIVRDAILRAEEMFATRVRQKLPTTSADRLATAVATVMDKVPGITEQEARDLVHTTLPKVGAGAAAFLAGVRQSATTGAR